ncbi:MAG: Uncharacterized protein XD92_1104 [Proteiniphilum acetatigenes]|jgi:magnesium-transporting ATPase (P-type)|uniref:DUF3307 domain-containing protein n=1 Tax=Proteiniphilum acetatigenes TaxID=294710 RepID=A0A124FX24_9BACT|nr:MAG: Uncharacterized protein XD92_1104 [Proteiniphilum acetatigenes]MBZ4651238.1 hypothetical protein [Proteiniphilum sp.]MDK2852322.1 hypothetical protein [Proteiniphilum sp.]
MVLIKLIFAHMAGDFLLQPKSWVEEKERQGVRSLKLYLHGFIHGALVLLLLWDLRYWPVAIAMTILHVLIDVTKIYRQHTEVLAKWFIIDQLLHLLTILIVWGIFFRPELSIGLVLENPLFWIYLTAILFLTVVCGIVIQILLGSWAKSIEPMKEKSLPNAGKYIGILERLLVFMFVVTGHWDAIGFLVAAKSVFRFGDLKDSRDRKITEYILIGTLLSFGIAIVVGVVARAFTAG